MAMKKPEIEEVEAESIRDDREGLLEFIEQRAKSIQRLKDQKSIVERKLAELRNLMAVAEDKYLRLYRVESDAISKTNPKMPGKNGTRAKTANETPTPQPRSEMDSLNKPSFVLPPSFKRRASASASARAQVNETTQAQPMKEKSGPKAKISPSLPKEAVRETQGQDHEAQSMATI